jgi:hypothetical protein
MLTPDSHVRVGLMKANSQCGASSSDTQVQCAIGIVPATTSTVDDGVEGTISDKTWPDGGVFVIKAYAYLEQHGVLCPAIPNITSFT